LHAKLIQLKLLSKIALNLGQIFSANIFKSGSIERAIQQLGFILPGKPTQNAFVESLNGKFSDECLNRHWFRTMAEARVEVM